MQCFDRLALFHCINWDIVFLRNLKKNPISLKTSSLLTFCPDGSSMRSGSSEKEMMYNSSMFVSNVFL